jgi:hypothetical protein
MTSSYSTPTPFYLPPPPPFKLLRSTLALLPRAESWHSFFILVFNGTASKSLSKYRSDASARPGSLCRESDLSLLKRLGSIVPVKRFHKSCLDFLNIRLYCLTEWRPPVDLDFLFEDLLRNEDFHHDRLIETATAASGVERRWTRFSSVAYNANILSERRLSKHH